jgi:hypothetical protein
VIGPRQTSNSFTSGTDDLPQVARLHFAIVSRDRCLTGQLPCRYTLELLVLLDFVFSDRVTPYVALLIGCRDRLALLMLLGVKARLTARPGWTARRTPRGMNILDKSPT